MVLTPGHSQVALAQLERLSPATLRVIITNTGIRPSLDLPPRRYVLDISVGIRSFLHLSGRPPSLLVFLEMRHISLTPTARTCLYELALCSSSRHSST